LFLARVVLFDLDFEVRQHLQLVELDEATYPIEWNPSLPYPEVNGLTSNSESFC
jgi:hypothetical protein